MKNPAQDKDFVRSTKMLKLWMDWHVRCSPRVNYTMALASALTCFGTIMGRVYVAPGGARASVYVAGLAPPGAGKDRPRQMAKALLRSCDRHMSIGSDNWGSDAGMIAELSRSSEMLWQVDEFWKMLKEWDNSGVASYKSQSQSMLLEWFSGATWGGKALKEDSIAEIKDPHVCLFATSQIDTWWENTTPEMAGNGLLARFLILENPEYAPMSLESTEDMTRVEEEMPKELPDLINGIMEEHRNPLSHALGTNNTVQIRYREADKQKIAALHASIERVLQDPNQDSFSKSIASREWEKTIRIAMIHAWSKGEETVELAYDSMRWAYELVAYTSFAVTNYTKRLNKNDYERNYEKVYRAIHHKRRADTGVTHRELVRMGVRDLDTIISQMVRADMVEIKTGPRGGPQYYAKTPAFAPIEHKESA